MAPSLSNKQPIFPLYPLTFSKFVSGISAVSGLDSAFDDSRVQTIHECTENAGERWDRIRWMCGVNDGNSNSVAIIFLMLWTTDNGWIVFDYQYADSVTVSFSTPTGPKRGEFLIDGGLCLKNSDKIGFASTNFDIGYHVTAEGGRFVNDQDG